MDRRNRPGPDPDATLIEGAAGRPRDTDATLIEGVAGRVTEDATLIEAVAPASPPPTGEAGLVEAASPLLIRLNGLRNTLSHPDPTGLKRRFEEDLAHLHRRASGFDPDIRQRAGRLLAFTVDDLLLHDTAWAQDWQRQGLLSASEREGDQQLLTLLRDCLEAPERHRALLELVHCCLALGLGGSYRSHPEQWRTLREQVHQALPGEPVGLPGDESSTPHPAPQRSWLPGWLVPAAGTALSVALYGGLRADLTARWQSVGDMIPVSPSEAATGPLEAVQGLSPTALLTLGGLGVALTLAGWGSQALLGRGRTRWRGRRLLTDLVRLAGESGHDRLGRALTELEGRIGSAALARLPWYWVLGEPGSGRRSALNTMAGDGAVEVADEGLCGGGRWLITDRAILIDDRGQGQGWRPLVERLVREGDSRLSVLALVAADQLPLSGRPLPHSLFRSVEERLRSLQQVSPQPLPVRLVITRMYRLPGFREFFDHLDGRRRALAWGSDSPDGFQGLAARLWQMLPQELWREGHEGRRRGLFAFPAQFATLNDPVGQLQQLLQNAGARPAGLYFTSALQQGDTVDRLVDDPAVTAQTLPLPLPLPLQRRSHFLSGLIAALEPRSGVRSGGGRTPWAVAAVLGLVAALWLTGYARERLYLERLTRSLEAVEAQAEALSPVSADPLEALPLLEAARRMPVPADDVLARLTRLAGPVPEGSGSDPYPPLLQSALLPRLQGLLERELEPRLLDEDPVRGLTTLAAYQALGSGGNRESLLDWWRSHRDRDDLPWQELEQHLTALVALDDPLALTLDQARLEQARRHLADMNTARRLYAQLRRNCLEEVLTDFDPATLDPTQVFVSPRALLSPRGEWIPGCFTRDGLLAHLPDRDDIRRALRVQGSVVEAGNADLDRLLGEVRQNYLEDYGNHWRELLANLELNQLTGQDREDFNRSLAVLERLADPGVSPLMLLLEAVDRHVHVEPAAVRQVDDDPSLLVERYLNGNFSGLHWAARTDNMVTLRRLLRQLVERLRVLMPAEGEDRESQVTDPAAREAALAAIRDLERFANYQPQPLGRWLGQLVDDGTDLVIRDQASRLNWPLNRFWLADVLQPCRQGIQGRYPLAPWGSEEASLEDFGAFFGNSGALATFFRQYLAEFVDTGSSPWRWRSGSGYGRPAVSDATLALFERGDAIGRAFFPVDGLGPQMLFKLQSLPVSTRVTMTLDGERVDFAPAFSRAYDLQWPGPRSEGVTLTDPGVGAFGGWQGPWGWLALLQEAGLAEGEGQWPYRVMFQRGGREVAFELRPEGEQDPFALIRSGLLEGFTCPARL